MAFWKECAFAGSACFLDVGDLDRDATLDTVAGYRKSVNQPDALLVLLNMLKILQIMKITSHVLSMRPYGSPCG